MRAPRPRTGKSIPTVLSIAHHGPISLSVLENIITPRAPCNSLAPDKLPTRLSLGCKVGAPLAGCQGFKKALGAQGSLLVPVNIHWKTQFRGEKAPLLPPLHRASWHPRSLDAGTLPLVLGAGFCCGRHGEGDYLHCGFWCKPSLSYCMNSLAQGWPSTKLGLPSLLALSYGPQVLATKGLSRFSLFVALQKIVVSDRNLIFLLRKSLF